MLFNPGTYEYKHNKDSFGLYVSKDGSCYVKGNVMAARLTDIFNPNNWKRISDNFTQDNSNDMAR